jgi:hypothetical protein
MVKKKLLVLEFHGQNQTEIIRWSKMDYILLLKTLLVNPNVSCQYSVKPGLVFSLYLEHKPKT